jgi:AcrR family transcriptional regulator
MRLDSAAHEQPIPSDDRSTKARIRDAAIECFATDGVNGTGIRTIAATAGVSPGLVIHYFGSKDALHRACDLHVAATIRRLKHDALGGAAFDPVAALRTAAGGPPLARYLARTLVAGSPHLAELIDELVADAVEYIDAGVESGLITPSEYPRQRAAILMMWSLGSLVLHEHLERLLGVDVTQPFDPAATETYLLPVYEIFNGFLTDNAYELLRTALAQSAGPEGKQ